MAITPNANKIPPSPGTGTPPDPGNNNRDLGGFPDGLVLLFGLVVVGGIAQLLHRVSPNAGWMFAIVVVLGYFAAGNQVKRITEGLNKLIGA